MGIRLTTPMSEINAAIQNETQRVEMLTIRAISYLGELCVIEARNRPKEISWVDRTGNLRSSVGYIIAKGGKIIKYSDFQQVKAGSEGVDEGKKFAEMLAKQSLSSYVLVVVAGMNYAEYVEAMENKIVLASAELYARKHLPTIFKKLKRQIAS